MDEWLRVQREQLQAQVVNVRSDMTHTRPLYFTTRRCTYSDVVSVVTTTHTSAGRVPARRNKELRKIKVPLTSATFISPLRNASAVEDEERQRRNEALWAENTKFMAALSEKRERRACAEGRAAIRIEALYRGHLIRRAAVEIATRCRIQKKLRALMKAQTVDMVLDNEQMRQNVRKRWYNAAVEVQRRYRGRLGMRVAAKEGVLRQQERLRNASRAIQCAARRRLCVLAVRLETAHESHLKSMVYARRIQSKFRVMRARRTVQSKQHEKESACATILQRSHRRFLVRGVLALKKKQVKDEKEDAGAKMIQRALRCARARHYVAALRRDLESAQLHSAATKLQSAYRGHLGERHAEAVVQAQAEEQILVAVLHIQRIGRGWISRQRVTEIRDDRSFDIFVQARLGDGEQVDDLFNGVVAADEKHSTTEEDSGGNTILLVAARWGHKKIARKCLRWEFDIDHENHDGQTALQLAVRYRHDEVAAYLIEKQARFETTGRTVLHEASANGLVATVTELLAREVHPSILDDDLRTPLHEAACSGASSETLQLLLKHEAVVNALDRDELTPLHAAAAGGHSEVLNALLEAGADVTLRDAEGQLAWHHALAGGHDNCAALLRERWLSATGQEAIEMTNVDDELAALRGAAAGDRLAVEGFVDSGVSVQATDEESGNTLLHLAASSGNEELVDFLLKRGADDTTTNAVGQLPLHLGATHALVAQRLLQQSGAVERALPKQDKSGRTPMHVAARAGLTFDDAMRSLPTAIKIGELIDNDGRTVLHDAARCPLAESKKACCSSLLKLGVPASAVDQQGRTALHIASMTDEGALCISELARTKAELEARDDAGRTALHIAAQHACAAVVQELLGRCGHAADAASVDKRGRSAAYYALRAGAIVCFRNLAAAAKPDVEARDSDGLTLLWAALRSRSSPCLREILERGSNQMELYPASGDSPLHVACRYGFTDGVYQLLSAGVLPAALNVRNKAGRTPLGEAVHGGYVDAAKALLENGADAKAVSGDGRTYMHAAADADVPSAGMLSLLLDVGGLKVDTTDADGNTPLHIAARSLAFDGPVRVKLLAINGADVDTATSNAASCTPLHLAAAAGASDNVKMLLELGANTTAVDALGCTALEMARAAGTLRCIEAFKLK